MTERTTAPSTVVTAYRLYLASAALAVVGLVLSVLQLPQTVALAVAEGRRQVRGQDVQGLDVDGIATATAIGTEVVGAVFTLAFAVLTVVFARKLLRGRNWARIVLTVFAGLHLLGLLALLVPGTSAVQNAVAVLEIALVVTAAVLTFLPSSAPWFRRTTLPPAW